MKEARLCSCCMEVEWIPPVPWCPGMFGMRGLDGSKAFELRKGKLDRTVTPLSENVIKLEKWRVKFTSRRSTKGEVGWSGKDPLRAGQRDAWSALGASSRRFVSDAGGVPLGSAIRAGPGLAAGGDGAGARIHKLVRETHGHQRYGVTAGCPGCKDKPRTRQVSSVQ